MSATDALEFLMVGATAVQVGTANFINPQASMDVVNGLEHYLKKNNMNHIKEVIGSLQTTA